MPLHKIPRVLAPGRQRLHRRQTSPVQRLIRIQHENPAPARPGNSEIPRCRKIHHPEIEPNYLRAILPRNPHRVIRRTGVHNNEFLPRPAYRIEATPQIARLILHDHAHA